MDRKKPNIEERQFRVFTIAPDSIDHEKRTVELAFSSETTDVERYYGIEILDHNPGSVRLGRLNDGGAVLLNHDPDCQIGVVENARIDKDRIGRATARFSKNEKADEIWKDVVDGIRRKVSVGYSTFAIALESSTAGERDVYRVTDWEPYEISIVSIPADISVGIGRTIEEKPPQTPQKEARTMTPEEIAAAAAAAKEKEDAQRSAPTPAAPVNVRKITDDALTAERQRVSSLMEVGDRFPQYKGPELARQMVAEGKNVDDLNAVLLERSGQTSKPVPSGLIGMGEGEIRQYSFIKAMRALADPKDAAAQRDAGFELEASAAAAEKLGREARGLVIPYDVLVAPRGGQRTLTTGTGSAGGYTVATDLQASSFIELLRNAMVTKALGARVLNGLVGNVAIPRQTGGATAYWVGEDTAPTGSQQTIDQVTMNPKTVAAFTDIGRKLLIQSSIDVENMVREDLAMILALEVDRVAFYGTGSNTQPLGLSNTTGVQTQSFATPATPTFAEIVSMETKVAAANALVGTTGYVTNATVKGNMKSTPKVAAQPIYVWGEGDTVNGYKAIMSNQITTGQAWFGQWADLVLGFWSGIDLTVDPYTGSNKGTVRVNVFQDTDVAIRHPVSFVKGS